MEKIDGRECDIKWLINLMDLVPVVVIAAGLSKESVCFGCGLPFIILHINFL